jgi:hypothetical protein
LAKVIFRKIAGRLVPITVGKVVEKAAHGGTDVTYRLREGMSRIGSFWARQSSNRPSRFFVGSHINKEFRGHGLGKEFYGKLANTVRKLGGKSFVGVTDNVATIKKVRESVGRTRGFVGKGPYSGTTFVTLLKKRKK